MYYQGQLADLHKEEKHLRWSYLYFLRILSLQNLRSYASSNCRTRSWRNNLSFCKVVWLLLLQNVTRHLSRFGLFSFLRYLCAAHWGLSMNQWFCLFCLIIVSFLVLLSVGKSMQGRSFNLCGWKFVVAVWIIFCSFV